MEIASKEFVDNSEGWKYFGYRVKTPITSEMLYPASVRKFMTKQAPRSDYQPEIVIEVPDFKVLQLLLMPIYSASSSSMSPILTGNAMLFIQISGKPKIIFEQIEETYPDGTRLLECKVTPDELRDISIAKTTIGQLPSGKMIWNNDIYEKINIDKMFIYIGYSGRNAADGLFRWK